MIDIITVNYPLEGDRITNTKIDGDITLLDADVVICDPSEIRELWKDVKRGSDNIPYMYSPNSDRIRATLNSRKTEVESLLENGKIIISFLTTLSGFKGEKGNRSEYDIITNYDFLPLQQSYVIERIMAGSSSVNSLKHNKIKTLFSPFFEAFKDEINYTAYLEVEAEGIEDYFILNKSSRPVAAIHKASNGLIVLLPSIPYKKDNQKLLGVIRSCSKKYLTNHVKTPPPSWVQAYALEEERPLLEKTEILQKEIIKLQEEKKQLEDEKNKITLFKGLLFEQGPELESIIIKAFQLLGFKAKTRKQDDLEHDIVFDSPEGRGIAEVEGKDNDAIHIGKLDQLNRVIDEDFDLTGTYPQGVLIGNHYRLTKPENRKDPFTEKVHIVANKKSINLLKTTTIYEMVDLILKDPSNENLKSKFRKLILTTSGEIEINN